MVIPKEWIEIKAYRDSEHISSCQLYSTIPYSDSVGPTQHKHKSKKLLQVTLKLSAIYIPGGSHGCRNHNATSVYCLPHPPCGQYKLTHTYIYFRNAPPTIPLLHIKPITPFIPRLTLRVSSLIRTGARRLLRSFLCTHLEMRKGREILEEGTA